MRRLVVVVGMVAATGALVALAGGGAGAADLVPKAPTLAAPAWSAPPVPMFGDFLDHHIVTHGPYKIAENESPRPTDRVFYQYNYFNNAGGSGVNVNRHTFGFEKTFLDGAASVGMRLPIFDNAAAQDSTIGDLSVILKYALYNNRATGTVLSTGLVVTLPNGQHPNGINQLGQNVHSALLQPFVGWHVNVTNDLFFHGFHSIAVPTENNVPIYLFNDIGVGYWLLRMPGSPVITGVIPTIEVHVNTPMHRNGSITPPDDRSQVNMVFGSHVQIYDRYMLGLGVGIPVSGPKPFDVEAIANFNFRF